MPRNPKRRNDGKCPQILKDGMMESHPILLLLRICYPSDFYSQFSYSFRMFYKVEQRDKIYNFHVKGCVTPSIRPRSDERLSVVSRMPKFVPFHSWFQLRSMKKKSELNPKTHRLAKNHHKSLETESLESAVIQIASIFL